MMLLALLLLLGVEADDRDQRSRPGLQLEPAKLYGQLVVLDLGHHKLFIWSLLVIYESYIVLSKDFQTKSYFHQPKRVVKFR